MFTRLKSPSAQLLWLLLASLFWRLFLSVQVYSGDLNNHYGWGQSLAKFGPVGAYDRQYLGIMQPTYPPLALSAFTTGFGLYQLKLSAVYFLNSTLDVFPSPLAWFMEDGDTRQAFQKVIAIV